jgi:hypothetical protein
MIMWIVKTKLKSWKHETLSGAMMFAKTVNEFVTITNGEMEFVGKFGYDEVKDKKLPDGSSYDWTMRRDETHRGSRKKLV